MECRSGCAACCIAPSIKQPLPGMPEGKKAGETCVNLDPNSLRCRIWDTEIYPAFCHQFKAETFSCGNNRKEALQILTLMEDATRP